MMITELIDQDDFRAQLQAWGLDGGKQLSLAECRHRLGELLSGPERKVWQERLASLRVKQKLLHPEVQDVLNACMK
ncbi:hypothetical protein [Oceanisphaera sp.]|uniref:hypothetical protein n=1 Tax=Oceanisphaera sp. TaxID=1929979 RepID=UPI003A92C4BB